MCDPAEELDPLRATVEEPPVEGVDPPCIIASTVLSTLERGLRLETPNISAFAGRTSTPDPALINLYLL
jgi:hypothetical protein